MEGTGRWQRRAPATCGALVVVTTATTFGPWASSGTKVRSSYAVVDIVERAGVLSGSAADLAGLWYFVPVLGGAALLAIGASRAAFAYAAATTLGAVVVAGGLLVARSPLVTEPGAVLGILGGIGTLLAGATALTTTLARRTDERSVGTDGG